MSYLPPQTKVTEEVNAAPSIAPILASPEDVLLVGPTSESYTKVEKEAFTMAAKTHKATLRLLESLNNSNPNTYEVVAGSLKLYWTEGAEAGKEVKNTNYKLGTNGEIETLTEEAANANVQATYEYVSSSYYYPKRFNDISLIQSLYGPAFKEGKVKSPLTLAAELALIGGVGSVILQPLFESPEVENPETKSEEFNLSVRTAPKGPTEIKAWNCAYASAFEALENVDFVVPVVGQSMSGGSDATQLAVFVSTEGFLNKLATQEEVYAIAVLAEDGTSGNASQETIRKHAKELRTQYGGSQNQQTVLLNCAKFQVRSPSVTEAVQYPEIGGQYAAASFAGGLAALPISSAYTRRNLSGFFAVTDKKTLVQKNKDAEEGLCVIEQAGQNVRCRHSITIEEYTNVARSEVNVVRAKFNLISSVKKTLENQVIGKIIADGNSPYVVKSAISGVLSSLQSQKAIVDYSTVTAEISSTNPTTIKARFSYRPSFVVNYIEVVFSLNLSAQVISAEATSSTG